MNNEFLLVAAGFALLILGAEALVHGGVAVARRFNVSPLLIGVTIVAYGTSTPELLVSVQASMQGAYGIAVGNVVGSNIFNILLILGLTAIIAPITVPTSAILRDGLFALIAVGLLIWITTRMTVMHWPEGVLFLGVLLAMAVFAYAQESRAEVQPSADTRHLRERPLSHPVLFDIVLIAAGIGLLILGADVLISGATTIARNNGISEAVIGLTLIAAGTSLPELATSVVAAIRGNPDIALGNVVGSNIYNILAILGIASLVGPLQIAVTPLDLWVLLGATLALFPPLLLANRIGRTYGLLLFAAYLGYVAYLFQQANLLPSF